MNKREFVWASGGTLLAGCAASVGAAAGPATPAAVTAEGTLAAWRERVGERFEVFGSEAGAALELRHVQAHAAAAGTEQFTLMFAVSGVLPGSGTQVLRQAGQPPLALFLDHAGAAPSGAEWRRADCCRLL